MRLAMQLGVLLALTDLAACSSNLHTRNNPLDPGATQASLSVEVRGGHPELTWNFGSLASSPAFSGAELDLHRTVVAKACDPSGKALAPCSDGDVVLSQIRSPTAIGKLQDTDALPGGEKRVTYSAVIKEGDVERQVASTDLKADDVDGDGISDGDCNDNDASIGTCDVHASCVAEGTRRYCKCDPGWTGDGMTCTDVDECATNNGGCDPHATCTNTPGSFTCTCNAGWRGDGMTCTDVNECATNNGGCDPNATCTNLPGSYQCTCNQGWTGDGKTCADIDECATNNGGCDPHATCTNLPGSYQCTCNPGWTGDGKTCTDIDECASNNGGCDPHATCTNTPGSWTCTCKDGWSGNGNSCLEIDKCLDNNGGCDPNATCAPTAPGAVTCSCKTGFLGNGLVCLDEECATSPCDGGPCPAIPANEGEPCTFSGAYDAPCSLPTCKEGRCTPVVQSSQVGVVCRTSRGGCMVDRCTSDGACPHTYTIQPDGTPCSQQSSSRNPECFDPVCHNGWCGHVVVGRTCQASAYDPCYQGTGVCQVWVDSYGAELAMCPSSDMRALCSACDYVGAITCLCCPGGSQGVDTSSRVCTCGLCSQPYCR